MAKYINADTLISDLIDNHIKLSRTGKMHSVVLNNALLLLVENAQAEDVELVVHCRDCKYRCNSYCHHKYAYGSYIHEDDYCSRGEREVENL